MDSLSTAQPGIPVPVDAHCPRCARPLADPQGLAWCQACGYCRTLDDTTQLPLSKPAETARPKSAAGFRPGAWTVVLAVGVVLLAAGCFAASRYYQLTPLQRALWTAIQVLTGLALLFAGQCYALLIIAPKEGTLHITDAFVPFRLYNLIFKYLPRTCVALWLCSWGLTLTLSALIFVGGLGHLLTYLPKSRESQQFQWK